MRDVPIVTIWLTSNPWFGSPPANGFFTHNCSAISTGWQSGLDKESQRCIVPEHTQAATTISCINSTLSATRLQITAIWWSMEEGEKSWHSFWHCKCAGWEWLYQCACYWRPTPHPTLESEFWIVIIVSFNTPNRRTLQSPDMMEFAWSVASGIATNLWLKDLAPLILVNFSAVLVFEFQASGDYTLPSGQQWLMGLLHSSEDKLASRSISRLAIVLSFLKWNLNSQSRQITTISVRN